MAPATVAATAITAVAAFTAAGTASARAAAGGHHIFGFGFAHAENIAGEVQRLASHRVVEVHRDVVFVHGFDGTHQPVPVLVGHRQHVSFVSAMRSIFHCSHW